MPPNLSTAQVALALIVLKSKPLGMSLAVYFGQLQKCIGSGSVPPPDHERLDSVAFWKRAYEESETAQAKLLDRIYELEQENTRSRNALTVVEVAASPIASNKRKRTNKTAAKANEQPKSCGVLEEATAWPEGVRDDSASIALRNASDDEAQYCSVAFMRHFFNVRQQILSKRPDSRALQQALRDLCGVAARLICESPSTTSLSERSVQASAPHPAQHLLSIALAAQRSYPSILQGLQKLCTKPHGPAELGSVIYESVVLFEAIMAKIKALAVQEATAKDQSKPKAKRARTKSRMPTQSGRPSSEDQEAALQSLAHLAVTMLTTVDPSKEAQSKLLEGYLCAFLDHLGSSLSLAVFNVPESPEQLDMFAGFRPPQGLKDMSNLDSGTALRAVQLQAPYLIYILENAMTFVHRHWTTVRSPSLAKEVKERLQQTLLKGVFGDDDTEMFGHALQRPMPPWSGLDGDPPTRHSQAVTPEWFTSEVWRILGWNILTGDHASSGKADIESSV